jgi:hypothetical protein
LHLELALRNRLGADKHKPNHNHRPIFDPAFSTIQKAPPDRPGLFANVCSKSALTVSLDGL